MLPGPGSVPGIDEKFSGVMKLESGYWSVSGWTELDETIKKISAIAKKQELQRESIIRQLAAFENKKTIWRDKLRNLKMSNALLSEKIMRKACDLDSNASTLVRRPFNREEVDLANRIEEVSRKVQSAALPDRIEKNVLSRANLLESNVWKLEKRQQVPASKSFEKVMTNEERTLKVILGMVDELGEKMDI